MTLSRLVDSMGGIGSMAKQGHRKPTAEVTVS